MKQMLLAYNPELLMSVSVPGFEDMVVTGLVEVREGYLRFTAQPVGVKNETDEGTSETIEGVDLDTGVQRS